MARVSVLAAGGIVLRKDDTPLIAVVRLRKRNEWVLPKGKLDTGETPRAAAEREVLEETGHDVSVHEFLGTLVYESGGRCKVVHYWRMEAANAPSHELMDDIKAVDWLPLDAAVGRLSRPYEQAFLAHVGPLALEFALRKKAKPQAAVKRRSRRLSPGAPAPEMPVLAPVASESIAASLPQERCPADSSQADTAPVSVATDEIAAAACAEDADAFGEAAEATSEDVALPLEEAGAPDEADCDSPVEPGPCGTDAAIAASDYRMNLVRKVRKWLRRAA